MMGRLVFVCLVSSMANHRLRGLGGLSGDRGILSPWLTGRRTTLSVQAKRQSRFGQRGREFVKLSIVTAEQLQC